MQMDLYHTLIETEISKLFYLKYFRYSWVFTNSDFQNDINTCGDDPQTIFGVCQDNRWYPNFVQDNKASELYQKDIWCLAQNITYELWFKVNRPDN